MPKVIRTLYCDSCELADDEFVELDTLQPDGTFPCPICEDGICAQEVGMPQAIGIIFSNAEYVKPAKRTFTSERAKQNWLRDNNINEFRKGDATDRAMATRARENAERAARRMGHRDEDERRKVVKQEKAKGWSPALDRK